MKLKFQLQNLLLLGRFEKNLKMLPDSIITKECNSPLVLLDKTSFKFDVT